VVLASATSFREGGVYSFRVSVWGGEVDWYTSNQSSPELLEPSFSGLISIGNASTVSAAWESRASSMGDSLYLFCRGRLESYRVPGE
jgi:hypothetical protein